MIARLNAGNTKAMVRQSQPTILLTRPLAQSLRFADQVGGAVISPLMLPEFLDPALPETDFAAVILTSETGVQAARRISATGAALPDLAYCVGNRTTQAARAAGFQALSAEGDASALLALIKARHTSGKLLLLRPEDTAGDLTKDLNSAGIDTVSVIVYRQKPQSLTAEATALLQGDTPVILPVFSPRSARLLVAEIRRINGHAPLWLAALSPAVAQAFDLPAELIQIAAQPDASAMLDAVTAMQQRGIGS